MLRRGCKTHSTDLRDLIHEDARHRHTLVLHAWNDQQDCGLDMLRAQTQLQTESSYNNAERQKTGQNMKKIRKRTWQITGISYYLVTLHARTDHREWRTWAWSEYVVRDHARVPMYQNLAALPSKWRIRNSSNHTAVVLYAPRWMCPSSHTSNTSDW